MELAFAIRYCVQRLLVVFIAAGDLRVFPLLWVGFSA